MILRGMREWDIWVDGDFRVIDAGQDSLFTRLILMITQTLGYTTCMERSLAIEDLHLNEHWRKNLLPL